MTEPRNTRSTYRHDRQNGGEAPNNDVNNKPTTQGMASGELGVHTKRTDIGSHTSTPSGPTPTDPHKDLIPEQSPIPRVGDRPDMRHPLIHPERPSCSTQLPNPPPPYNTHLHHDESLSVSFNLSELTKSVKELSSEMAAMRVDITDMRTNINEGRIAQDAKLAFLETNCNTKYDELSSKIDTRSTTQDTAIASIAALSKTSAQELTVLREMVHAQSCTISELQDLVLQNDIKATRAFKEVQNLANNIEAHQRRWAVRIHGMDAPDTPGEQTDTAKHRVLDFIRDKLQVDNVRFEDIDCAHRVGRIIDKKQTMLVRCFNRDLIQMMLRSRYNLKESALVLHEDSPLLNRQLLQTLKDDARTESSWIYNGSVWTKLASNGKIAKFNLLDNIDEKLDEEAAKQLGRPAQRKPTHARKSRNAWNKYKRQSSSAPSSTHMTPLPATTQQTQNSPRNLQQTDNSQTIPSLLDILTSSQQTPPPIPHQPVSQHSPATIYSSPSGPHNSTVLHV
jgi:hypothetical protein